jgi:hypothetical protein
MRVHFHGWVETKIRKAFYFRNVVLRRSDAGVA